MTWGHGNYNCHELPRIYSYAQAEKRYNDTPHVRGTNNVRPLGKRRTTHMQIVKGVDRDAEGGALHNYYAARLYKTDCVKFMEPMDAEGTEIIKVRVDRYPTPTTTAFIKLVLPLHGVELRRGKVRIKGHTVPSDGELTITKRKDEDWDKATITGREVEYTHSINRKKANALRKHYAPLLNWVKGTLSLKENKFSMDELMDVAQAKFFGGLFQPNHYHKYNDSFATRRAWFMQWVNAPDEDPHKYEYYMKALHLIVHELGVWKYRPTAKILTLKMFEQALLRLHADEVLDRHELALGEIKPDKYKYWAMMLNT